MQYLKVGADKDPKSAKFASRTSFGIFLGMPVGQSGFLIFDPTRAGVLVRSDVKLFDDIPGYPRLMSAKARMQATPTMIKNPVQRQKAKHFNVVYHWVRE